MDRLPIRVYADTSVFGGIFDDEFSRASHEFFDQVRKGKFHLLTSALVVDEIAPAPVQVRSLFEEMTEMYEVARISAEALELQQAYLGAEIVSPKWINDALHVAIAVTNRCDMIVSWNFKHIVHYRKIPQYNAVNTLNGYSSISIHSPLEVIADDDQ